MNNVWNGAEISITRNEKMDITDYMGISPLDSLMCGGCTIRDLKIRILMTEIYNLKKSLNHQKNLNRHLNATSPVVDLYDGNDDSASSDSMEITQETVSNHRQCTSSKQDKKMEVKSVVEMKQFSNQVPKTLKCRICNETFGKSIELELHLKVHNVRAQPNTKFERIPSQRPATLVRERRTRPSFECYICRLALRSHKKTKEHMKSTHIGVRIRKKREKYERCVVCNEKVIKHEMDQHFCGTEDHINCAYCQQKLTSTKQILEHLKSNHSDITIHKCVQCSKFIEMAMLMKYHQQYHEKHPKSFVCPKCPKAYESQEQLANHLIYHSRISGESSHLCEDCGKSFVSSYRLKFHRRTHEEPTLKCPDCPKLFRTATHLKNHSNIHVNVTFVCFICSAKFTSKDGLNKHSKTIHANTEKLQTHNSLTPSVLV